METLYKTVSVRPAKVAASSSLRPGGTRSIAAGWHCSLVEGAITTMARRQPEEVILCSFKETRGSRGVKGV